MTASAREFVDTNIVVHAFTGDPRSEMTLALLRKGCTISVQVLNEFANVARRKLDMSRTEVETALSSARTLCPAILPMDIDTHLLTLGVAERHKLSVFDAPVIAAALQGGGETLWSEDMHHGLIVDDRLRIVKPFRE